MIAVIGLIIGIALGVLLDPTVPAWLAPFLPVAVVAGLDALFGAGRAWLEGRFADRVFVTSFFCNDDVPEERGRCVSARLPGHPAGRWIRHDDSRRRRAGDSYLLQYRIDPSTAPEGLT